MSKDKDKNKVDDADFDDLLNDLKDLAAIPKELKTDDTDNHGVHSINKPTPIHTNPSNASDDIATISNKQQRMTPRSTKSQSIVRPKSFVEFKASIVSSEQENVFNYNQTPSHSISKQSRQKQKQRSRSRSVSLSIPSKKENEQKYPLTARSRKSRKERLKRTKTYTESVDIKIPKTPNEYVYNYRSPGAVFGFTPRSCNNKLKTETPPVGLYQPKIDGISQNKPIRGGIISRSKRFKSISTESATVGLYTPQWSYSKKPIAKGGTFGQSNRFNKYNRKRNRNYSKNMKQKPSNEYIDYNQSSFKSLNSKGGLIGKSRRFRETKVKVPGPGTYGVIHSLNHSRLPYSIHTRQNKK